MSYEQHIKISAQSNGGRSRNDHFGGRARGRIVETAKAVHRTVLAVRDEFFFTELPLKRYIQTDRFSGRAPRQHIIKPVFAITFSSGVRLTSRFDLCSEENEGNNPRALNSGFIA